MIQSRQQGFTYLAVMFLVALMGLTATATAIVWRIEQRRADEAELLFAGAEFVRAIEAYRAVAPSVPQPWPVTLEQLLRDPRTPGVRRYLRRIYRDPVARSARWGLIRTPQGGIVGVYSQSTARPIRRMPPPGLVVRDGGTYAEWLFVAAGAPSIVRDARSGGWVASGPPPVAVPGAVPAQRPGQPTAVGPGPVVPGGSAGSTSGSTAPGQGSVPR
jgi:type II secretory pathway pseudopilin PulG